MYQPYIDILVDGVMRRREATYRCESTDLDSHFNGERMRLRPCLERNEVPSETLDGHMEVVTIS